jgi:class 3 adenylate cyclase
MAAEPLKRKLVTILATDAVGYSRHMAADEEGTLKILSAHRAVIDGIIEFHEGRILNTAGDSVLAEFASPVQAVRSAVEIQDALRTRNDSLPEDRRLLFRIGINLGDVMIKGNDLLGDGVNVAARLESIAEPGGICISSSVYDQISGKLDLGFVDEGQQSLKNIDRPVRAYRIERTGEGRRTTRRPAKGGGTAAKWLGGGALALALAAAAWQFVLIPLEQKARDAEAQAESAATAERKRAEELAKAREEVAAAKQKVEAQAAAAVEAKRAFEARHAAAEIARERAEAEKARREATAQLAAAAEARRKAEAAATEARRKTETAAAAPPAPVAAPTQAVAPAVAPVTRGASLEEGRWVAHILCPSIDNFPERNLTVPVAVENGLYLLAHGASSAPGSLTLKGRLTADGTLQFRGAGITGKLGGVKPYPARLQAKPVGDRYEGAGRLGRRECTLAITRVG